MYGDVHEETNILYITRIINHLASISRKDLVNSVIVLPEVGDN